MHARVEPGKLAEIAEQASKGCIPTYNEWVEESHFNIWLAAQTQKEIFAANGTGVVK